MTKTWFTEVQLALITVYVIVMVDVFGLTLIFPVIVTYAKFLGATEASIGYLYAVYASMALLCSLFVGRLSDRYGRRAVFLYCCVGALASFIGSAFSTTFVQFAACRAISGLFTGTMGNAYAYIADIVAEEDKSRYMSYITATMSTCFVIGPIIGGGFAEIDIRAPFVVAAVMAFIELVLIYFFVHDPKHVKTQQHHSINSTSSGSIGSTVYNPLVNDEEVGVALSPVTHNTISTTINTTNTNNITNTTNNTNRSTADTTDTTSNNELEAQSLENTENGYVALSNGSTSSSKECYITEYSESDTVNPIHKTDTSTTTTNTTTNTDTTSIDDSHTTSHHTNTNDSTYTTHTTDTAHTTNTTLAGLSPWLDIPSLVLGGVGNFLTTTTYCGMATIVPLMLMDPTFGVIHTNTNDDISDRDSSRISVRISYLLTVLGVVQVCGMVFVFPRISQKIGLMYTGAIGSFIYGVVFCTLVFVHTFNSLYPVVIGLAVGFSICKPVYPAYLSERAHKDRRAEYQAMSMSFNQMAWIFSIVLTQFWVYSETGAILYCGGASILNAIVMLGYGLHSRQCGPDNSMLSVDTSTK